MMDEVTLDRFAEIAAQQAIAQYGGYVTILNLTNQQFKYLIRRIAEHAVKIVDTWPG